MSELEESFPLFPLELVLLPHEVVPLHIFEERYKLMIGSCLEQDSEFGILWLSDDGLREVGCSARVAQVLERAEDGRMNILAQGGRPFRTPRETSSSSTTTTRTRIPTCSKPRASATPTSSST